MGTERIGNNVVDDYILDISQHKVLVTKEKFTVTSARIETESDHSLLPAICTVDKSGCATGQGTYVWYTPHNSCSLEVVRTTAMTTYRDYLVDKDNKIIIKKVSAMPAPSNCPSTLLYATEYNDLFITSGDISGFPELTNHLNFEDFVRCRDDYLISSWNSDL